jgi:hypothetical protein
VPEQKVQLSFESFSRHGRLKIQSLDNFWMATLESRFDLLFNGKAFTLPKKYLFELLEHLGSIHATSYAVRSAVPLPVFETFFDSLKSQTKISVTKENAVSLSLLAREFRLSDVSAECATFSVSVDQFAALSERVSELERQLSSVTFRPAKIEERLDSQEEGLEHIRLHLERLRASNAQSVQETSPRPQKPVGTVEFPLTEKTSLVGLIAYLTRKHGGNVHARGIVTLTLKSMLDGTTYAVRNVLDLTSDPYFYSKNEPGQWVCWDFRDMRVCPTHYTMYADYPKSWVLEGSVDGQNWADMDRQTDNLTFKRSWVIASFAVQMPLECRFIRLTQTDKNHYGDDCLYLRAVEFFGTLAE